MWPEEVSDEVDEAERNWKEKPEWVDEAIRLLKRRLRGAEVWDEWDDNGWGVTVNLRIPEYPEAGGVCGYDPKMRRYFYWAVEEGSPEPADIWYTSDPIKACSLLADDLQVIKRRLRQRIYRRSRRR